MYNETVKKLTQFSEQTLNKKRLFAARLAWIIPIGVLVLLAFGLFLGLSFPGNKLTLPVEQAARYKGFNGFNAVERSPDGQAFAWSKRESYLAFADLPRYLPLTLYLEISLDRPSGTPPAQLEINEVNDTDNNLVQPLATLNAVAGSPGFRRYTISVPARPALNAGLTLQLNSNSFRETGGGRLLGVGLRQVEIETAGGRWNSLWWPLPLAPAVLLLILTVGVWARVAGVGLVETGGLLLLIAITTGEQIQYLRPYSWWLLGCAITLAVCAVGWQRLQGGRWEIFCILAGIAVFGGFFIVAHEYDYDLGLYREWIGVVHQYGPFDLYSHSDTFNYPPLIGYFFWLYGLIMTPLGVAGHRLAIKGVMLLAILLTAWLIWRQSGPTRQRGTIGAVLLFFGLNTATIYNPAVWGQADAILGLMLITAFYLLYRNQYWWVAILLGLSLLFKPQAIFVVPLLALVLLKRAGWRRTLLGLGVSLLVFIGLALPAFGFRFTKIQEYLFQSQLAGGLTFNEILAYNFQRLFNSSLWAAYVGLAIVGLVYLGLTFYVWKGRAGPGEIALSATLAVTIFFTFAVKMHERYLYYALPFLALAVYYTYREAGCKRNLSWFWVAFSLLALLEPTISRYSYQTGRIAGNLFNWSGWLRQYSNRIELILNLASIGLAGWALVIFLQAVQGEKRLPIEPEPDAFNPTSDKNIKAGSQEVSGLR